MDKAESFGFGARLKAARTAAKMTGAELGRGAGAKPGEDAGKQSVSDWESERHYPKANQIRTICLKLNVSADHLIFGDVRHDKAVAVAVNVVQALSPEQRRALLAAMMGDAIADEQVAKHLPPPPSVKRINKQ